MKPRRTNTPRSAPTSTGRPPPSTSKFPARRLPPPTPSEAAFEALLASFDAPGGPVVQSPANAGRAGRPTPVAPDAAPSVVAPAPPGSAPAAQTDDDAARIDALFARRDEFLSRDRFHSIGDADAFFTKIVGVSFEKRQLIVAGLQLRETLDLVREPGNEHDANAIQVRFGSLQLGFLRREIAKHLAPNIDAGEHYSASVGSLTGGGADRHVGVNIYVRRHRRVPLRPAGARESAARAFLDGEAASERIRHALIGERPIREAQRDILERVAAGRNTLAVLGTGRGKSFCFQLPAAERALASGAKTLVFYPLRALANDQHAALERRLGPLGLRVLRANGSLDGDEREALHIALEDGAWDIMLATPEFAAYHREAFARACNRPSLLVVDEAHHLQESRHRPAYVALGELLDALGRPQVLALTATANDAAFAEIRRALGIDAWVIDPTVRENLQVVDARNTADKTAYLERELAGPGKAIVYCNSRSETTKLAERLRRRFGSSVGFYHAGMPAAERALVEELFRRGALGTVIATSAFGEGIDLPDVRDVVLYHLNFALTEFNQQAGRAGRDDAPARIHLLFGDSDRKINDFIIARSAPGLPVLRELYRGMRGLGSFDALRMTYQDVARTLDIERADENTVAAAVRIWEEAGLVTTGRDDEGRFVRFLEVAGKVDLTQTTRYAEGLVERESFERFCTLALGADAPTLEALVNRPIYPDRVPQIL